MLWITILAFVSVIAIVVAIIGFMSIPEDPSFGTGMLVLAAGGWVAIMALATFFLSMHTVQAGHVGVVYSFGAITDQTGDGVVWTKPWESVKEANIQIQREKFENMGAASKETQDVFFTVTLNYQVSPNAVQDLYRNVGPDYFEKLVESRLNQYFKDESVKYAAIDITTKRDEIREEVTKRLADDLEPYSISVVALLIDNINYSDAFNQAIEAKEVARQDAIKEQNLVEASKSRALQAEAVAQGEANSTRIRAQGQAEANALLTNSLTPQLIQWEAVQRLSDNVNIALIPSGQGIIIDPASILAGGN